MAKAKATVVAVIHSRPADSPGYTHVTVDAPVGSTQAGAVVTVNAGELVQEIVLHGQREFDVLAGADVRFPDGSIWAGE